MSDGQITIALYRPYPGKERELLDIVQRHVPTLRLEGYITEFASLHLQSEDGTILEIFEWKSLSAKDQAHYSPAIQQIWDVMMQVAEMTTLSTLPEATKVFPIWKQLHL
ncbi:hypothetical protein BVG16_29645 [Paenibacillus selenitireducens]|uniref:ABM domain-containing protein n=1 Tax=Paenibacillus selenitireducens TaxID=1324314 RepID=A0A1T2X0L7_9BACL|nr:hypothetical protein [Paenibacillus selenitireducens]OPA73246.1 hypothetical protein BVG16_29645 [Paenibacillus selenitireducens]